MKKEQIVKKLMEAGYKDLAKDLANEIINISSVQSEKEVDIKNIKKEAEKILTECYAFQRKLVTLRIQLDSKLEDILLPAIKPLEDEKLEKLIDEILTITSEIRDMFNKVDFKLAGCRVRLA